ERRGVLVDTGGNVLGEHAGVAQFTVGQRKGLGLDRATLRGERRFVLDILPETAPVVLGSEEEGQVTSIEVTGCNWFLELSQDQRCQIKWSHWGEVLPGSVKGTGDTASVEFDEPQFGIAQGQAIVFYECDYVLGGGWVS